MSGRVKKNPDPFTLKELWWMYRGADKQEWEHTSQILCILYQINRGEDSPELEPADFNPYYAQYKSTDARIMVDDLSFLKQFCHNKEGE